MNRNIAVFGHRVDKSQASFPQRSPTHIRIVRMFRCSVCFERRGKQLHGDTTDTSGVVETIQRLLRAGHASSRTEAVQKQKIAEK